MDLDSTCWLISSAEVRQSPIEGAGLFAMRPIPAETLVARLGGTLVCTRELHQLFDNSEEYIDTITVG